MATTFDFLVSLPANRPAELRLASEVLRRAHAEVARLESELSEFRASSPVHRLNASAPGERVALPASVLELLGRAETVRARSAGRFDCTAKGPVDSRGGIAWSLADRQAWRTHAEAHLGFGAIGKGYALDAVRHLLEEAGFTDFLLSGGGSSVVLAGFAAPEDPWTWGWSWEKDARGEDRGLRLVHGSGRPIALGVSGLHEKGNHIVATAAKTPARPPASSLVATASATDADAWSTALFLADFEDGLSLLADHPGAAPAVARIDADGTPRWNGTFQRLWGTPA